ncbi:hypothetical protein ZOSMA_488G00010 [Zostera marina]|uniref:RING-type domain-containing protein n=1 Tax=Zostera marina TaxID=29655 RepID=A0A0K9NZE3_ZOSMR|nr:hypothetical protein ZOSMA_488G00010 [Zostera marina]
MDSFNLSRYETSNVYHGLCAICLDQILLEQTAMIKDCEHIYCIHDYMFEESVLLFLPAACFVPIEMENECIVDDFEHDEQIPVKSNMYFDEDDDDDDIEESFFMGNLSNIRISNRRWGNNGFVTAGRKKARPINKEISIQCLDGGHSGPSRPAKVGKEDA